MKLQSWLHVASFNCWILYCNDPVKQTKAAVDALESISYILLHSELTKKGR